MKKLVILGGGTAGCITAALLSRLLKPQFYEITLIDSSHVSSIGVGESVLPSFIRLLQKLGLDEKDLMKETGASIKLGVQFRDWRGNDESFFHHLGGLGCKLSAYDFFDCWLKARSRGDLTPLQDYVPAAVMAREQRFDLPGRRPTDSPLTQANHSLHMDAGLVSIHLREFALQRKLNYIKAHVVRVNLGESGSIESLELNNHEIVEGDFFLDCSGLRSMLVGEALNSSFESWKHFLPCDRAVAVQTANQDVIPPYSITTAKESGWIWRVPLQQRISTGYVFSSGHSSDREASRVLLDSIEGEPLQEPHFIPFHNGIRKTLWKKNCIAIGLAGGFLEPLASTAIHLAIRGVESMLELFPDLNEGASEWPVLATEYNRRMLAEYEEIRDFIALHYYANDRTDTEFWRQCQSRPVPDSLATRIELFKTRAELQVAGNSLFQQSNWQAVFTGMGVIPRTWHPFVDMADFDEIQQAMQENRTSLNTAVQRLPTYQEFLNGKQGAAGE